MPTGYTAPVMDGDVTELSDFMSRISHAFIAELRDTASDGPLPAPGKFVPNEYSVQAHAKAVEERDKLFSMTDAEARAAQRAEWEQGKKHHDEYQAEKQVKYDRYFDMLMKVEAWVPPTDRHQGVKDFAIKQLEESIDFDCRGRDEEYPPLTMSVSGWRADQIGQYNRTIDYYAESLSKDEARFHSNKEWIEKFKESLNIPLDNSNTTS